MAAARASPAPPAAPPVCSTPVTIPLAHPHPPIHAPPHPAPPRPAPLQVATLDSVVLYDTQSPLPLAVLGHLHYDSITDLAWSSDGQYLAVSSRDCYCRWAGSWAPGWEGATARLGAVSAATGMQQCVACGSAPVADIKVCPFLPGCPQSIRCVQHCGL